MGRQGRVANTRELVVLGTPYIVAYVVLPDGVKLLRVLHGAQQWRNRCRSFSTVERSQRVAMAWNADVSGQPDERRSRELPGRSAMAATGA